MDATKITLAPGVVLSRYLGYVDDLSFVPKVTDSLLAWHNIGVSAERAARNWASGMPNATVIGDPIIGDGFAVMTSQASYLQTDTAETDLLTWYAVARNDEIYAAGKAQAQVPVMISNYSGGPGASDAATASLGSLLWWAFSTGNATVQACRRDGATAPVPGTTSGLIAASAPADWACYMMRCTSTTLEVRNLTIPSVSPVQAFAQARFRGTRKLRIGSAYQTSVASCQMANAVVYGKAQTEVEIAAVYAQIKEYQLRRWGRHV